MASSPSAGARPLGGARAEPADLAHGLLAPHRLALLGILGLSLALGLWELSGEGTANQYYAAAVRSMTENPTAFFFGAFDAGGFITLDKPPLGFWLQALSVLTFGYSGVALLLPQVLATSASVGVLYALVRDPWGTRAGLLAALALAIMPITVAVGRNNTPDPTLVLALLAAAWSLQRGLRSGRLRWLTLAMVLVGVGFNIKMLEAWLVLPAFGFAWIVAAPGRLARRIGQVALAVLPLLVVSLAWVVVVDLVPAGARPYVGGSQTNSALELALGYDGLERLTGGMPFADTGTAGPFRFLEPVLAGQVGWLLPWALAGGLAALPMLLPKLGARRRIRGGSLLLWGGWLATTIVFFSIAQFWHRHYLVVVAPAVAALAGLGAIVLWRAYRGRGWAGWLLPAAVAATALLARSTIAATTELTALADPMLFAGLSIALALALVRGALLLGTDAEATVRRAGGWLVVAALVVGLLPSVAWSAWTAAHPSGSSLPTGGPAVANAGSGPGGLGRGGFPGGAGGFGGPGTGFPGGGPGDRGALLGSTADWLIANRGGATWIAATASSQEAAPIIVATGAPVMALGGFSGGDPAIDVAGFRALVAQGKVRYVLTGGFGGGGGFGFGAPGNGPGGANAVIRWAARSCAPVSGVPAVYDCAGA